MWVGQEMRQLARLHIRVGISFGLGHRVKYILF